MNSQKDNFSSNQINKTQEVEVNEYIKDNQNKEEITPLFFIIKRTQKLTTALYMVTDFMSDKEPLKLSLRKKSLEILADICSTPNKNVSPRSEAFLKSMDTISEIISLFEIAFSVNLISTMNHRVINREYLSLKNILGNQEEVKQTKERIILPHDFFTEIEQLNSSQQSSQEKNKEQKDSKDIAEYKRQKLNNNVLNDKKTNSPKHTYRTLNTNKETRRKLILKSVKSRRESTIKDIVKVLPDCGEKTIQRELISMVKEGVLKKKGERRWSRYFL